MDPLQPTQPTNQPVPPQPQPETPPLPPAPAPIDTLGGDPMLANAPVPGAAPNPEPVPPMPQAPAFPPANPEPSPQVPSFTPTPDPVPTPVGPTPPTSFVAPDMNAPQQSPVDPNAMNPAALPPMPADISGTQPASGGKRKLVGILIILFALVILAVLVWVIFFLKKK